MLKLCFFRISFSLFCIVLPPYAWQKVWPFSWAFFCSLLFPCDHWQHPFLVPTHKPTGTGILRLQYENKATLLPPLLLPSILSFHAPHLFRNFWAKNWPHWTRLLLVFENFQPLIRIRSDPDLFLGSGINESKCLGTGNHESRSFFNLDPFYWFSFCFPQN